MAVTVTDNRTTWDPADSTTGWVGGTVSLVTSDPDPVEATGHLGNVVSSATVDCYFTGTSTSMTGKLLYGWALSLGAMDTLVNGGVALLLGDGTNRMAYHLSGSDVAVFRHNSGQPSYQCLLLDQSSLPTNKTVRAGAEVSLNFGAITQMGVMFKTLAKSKGGTANCFVDIIRILDPSLNNGCALTISGGTSGAGAGTFTQIAAEDASIADVKAHGVARVLGAGAIGLQGPLRFGDQGTGSSWFEDKNVTVIFEDRNLAASRYKIVITDNGTGTTTFRLGTKVGTGVAATGSDGVTITGGANVNWQFDAATDTDVTDVFIYGSTFNRATQGVSFRSGHEFIGGIISASGTITANGATLVNTNVVGSTAASALLWNVATDVDGKLDGMSFTMGASGHGLELGASTPNTITLRGVIFTGYGADGTTNAAVYNNSGKAITINILGSGTTPTIRNGTGASTSIITGVRTVKVAVTSVSGPVTGANVYLAAAAGGPFPANVSVTISRLGTTATVSHTGHGMATNDKVAIKGITDKIEDNAVQTITGTTANTYTYTTTNTGSLGYTGAITSTFVFLKGLASAGTSSNEISLTRSIPSDQPVTGWARKSTSAPRYKEGAISGTVVSTGDTTFSPVLISDD